MTSAVVARYDIFIRLGKNKKKAKERNIKNEIKLNFLFLPFLRNAPTQLESTLDEFIIFFFALASPMNFLRVAGACTLLFVFFFLFRAILCFHVFFSSFCVKSILTDSPYRRQRLSLFTSFGAGWKGVERDRKNPFRT